MRTLRLALPALGLLISVGTISGSAAAQGWNPFPDRDPPAWSQPRPQDRPSMRSSEPTMDAQRGWSPSPTEPAVRQEAPASPAQAEAEPGPGRGRPPGYLGELRDMEGAPRISPAAPGRNDGGSIIPDRQAPAARSQRSPAAGVQGAQQAMPREAPRESLPGNDRRYDDRQPAGRRDSPAQPATPSRAAPAVGRGPFVGENLGEKGREVEAQDLAPVMGADGSRLPNELWRGMTVAEIEKLMGSLAIPPRSAALHDLWRRLLIARSAEPSGGKTATHFLSLRLAALYKSGLLKDLEAATGSPPPALVPIAGNGNGAKDGVAPADDLVLAVQRAKAQLGHGQREAACASARSARYQGEVPRPVAQDALLLIAYCAAAEGNPAAASLTVDLAREQRMEAPLAFAIVDHMASGNAAARFKPALPKDVSLIDYRFLQLVQADDGLRLMERAEPALVAALARESTADPRTHVEAAEDAARIYAIDPDALARAYREVALPADSGDPLSAAMTKLDPPSRRAALAQAIATERTPVRKARLIQALLQEARSHTLYVPVAQGLMAEIKTLKQAGDVAFFAETAVEIALAGGDYAAAVSWAVFGSVQERGADRSGRHDGLMHWMTLIDIAGAQEFVPRGSGLKLTEELALKGKFAPEVLHRLVTVLDALEYNIPIPLWDAASRTPQPAKGHLPETGVLGRLQTAATERKFALTVLLAMQALGPEGAEGAHVLALGDTIRALKLAGLEEDARRLGFEALFAAWPRGVGG